MRCGPTATFFSVISEQATSRGGGGFFMGKNFVQHWPVGNIAFSDSIWDSFAFYFVWYSSFSKNYFCVQEKKSILSDCGFWFSRLSKWLLVLGWRRLDRFVFYVYLLLLVLLSSVFTSRMSSTVQRQRHQLSAIAAAHPPAWSVGSCWQYLTSFGICHKGRCRLLQGPTSFDRMHSGLGWFGSNLEVLSSV